MRAAGMWRMPWLLSMVIAHAVLMTRVSTTSFRHHGTPPVVLFVSSPMEKKVTYAQMKDFKAPVVEPLIDSGLQTPYGIAYDKVLNVLYVADLGAKMIYCYKIEVEKCHHNCKFDVNVRAASSRIIVAQNVESQWVTVDPSGNMYFTDQAAKSINKISKKTLQLLLEGSITAGDLAQSSEQDGLALAEADASEEMQAISGAASSGAAETPAIQTLYSEAAGDHVGTPGGIAASQTLVWWANQAEGDQKGSVVGGPNVPQAAIATNNEGVLAPGDGAGTGASSRTWQLASNTGTAFGLTTTYNMLAYTDNAHYVYGVTNSGGKYAVLSEAVSLPRGMAWDGDSTIYVADQTASEVVSMPCGRFVNNVPTSSAVALHDAFGLAIMLTSDPALEAAYNSAAGLGGGLLLLILPLISLQFS